MKLLLTMMFTFTSFALSVGAPFNVYKIEKGKNEITIKSEIKKLPNEKNLKLKIAQRKLEHPVYDVISEKNLTYNREEIVAKENLTKFEVKVNTKGLTNEATMGFKLIGKRTEQVKGANKTTHESTFIVNIADKIKNDLEVKLRPKSVGKKTLFFLDLKNNGNALIYKLKTRLIVVEVLCDEKVENCEGKEKTRKIGLPAKDTDPHFTMGPGKSAEKRVSYKANLKPGKYQALVFIDSSVAELFHKEVIPFEIKKKRKKKKSKK